MARAAQEVGLDDQAGDAPSWHSGLNTDGHPRMGARRRCDTEFYFNEPE
jgi:hypothetical protein